MGLMVLACEVFMMMINVGAQTGGRKGRGCDDDEWWARSHYTPSLYYVQT